MFNAYCIDTKIQLASNVLHFHNEIAYKNAYVNNNQ